MAPPVRISDHALVRFLERAGGLDVHGVRMHLQASLSRSTEAAHRLGLADFTVRADGLCYRVVNGTLVTVVDENDRGGR